MMVASGALVQKDSRIHRISAVAEIPEFILPVFLITSPSRFRCLLSWRCIAVCWLLVTFSIPAMTVTTAGLMHDAWAAQSFSNLSQAHLEHGLRLLNTGNLDEALAAFQAATALDPRNAEAYANAGYVLGRKHLHHHAIQAYQEAFKLRPDDPRFAEAYVSLAYELEQAGDLDGAIAAWQSALRLRPGHMPARQHLEYALALKRELEGTVTAWEESVRLHPEEALFHTGLGFALGRAGDLEGEILAWREAIRLQPDQALPYVHLGHALGRSGDPHGEIAAYREALRLQPDDPALAPVYFSLAYALGKTGEQEQSVTAWRHGLRVSARREVVQPETDIFTGNVDPATRYSTEWQEMTVQGPGDAKGWVRLGRALGQKGDVEGEVQAYHHAIDLHPPPPLLGEAYAQLGHAFARNGAWEDAIKAYETLARLRPDDRHLQQQLSEAHRQWGLTLIQQGELERGIQELQSAIHLNPSDKQAREALESALMLKHLRRE